MRTIRLYGVLGSKFGREYRLDCNSPADAVQALCNMVPGFEQFMRTADQKGLVFAVFSGKRNLSEDELIFRGTQNEVIRIAPIIKGSKNNGIFQTIIGAVMVVVGAFTTVFTAGTSSALVAAGLAMMAGGVVQMLSPMPKVSGTGEEDGNNPSTGFGGPVTTTSTGHPVPLLYGEFEVGGAVLSGGIYTEDQA
ncbi:tail assembly protein [Shewanella algae]|uniref:tail assembly protein n=1 Tax=Shewanella algae TaxID=38313 RepID=UPI00313C58E0